MYKLMKTTGVQSMAPLAMAAKAPSIQEHVDSNNIRTVEYYPYVSGLVFWLDGVHKGTTANAWTDLIGGLVFTNTGCTELDNCWQITNTTSTKNSLRNEGTLPFGSGSVNTHTIECVYYTDTARAQVVFSPKTANTILFGLSATVTRLIMGTDSGQWGLTTTNSSTTRGFRTASLNKNGGLLDTSISLSKNNNNNMPNGTWNGIGARSNDNQWSFNGRIYSIRVYNRLLTADEMIHNQLVDMHRFNLPITI